MTDEVPRFEAVADSRPSDRPWSEMTWPVPASAVLCGHWVTVSPFDGPADPIALYAALDDQRVWAHLADRPSTAEEFESILRTRAARPDWLIWVVRAARPIGGHATEDVIGMSSYLEVAPPDARLEIGFTAYTPDVWATAVNPETKLLLLGYAFETLGVGRVQLKTDVRNVRSQQAIARLGASYEGTLRRYQRRADRTVRDTVLFSILAEEWPQVRDRLRRRLDDH